MIKLIGRKGCTNCLIAKKQLTRAKVEFEYLDLDTLDNKEELISNAKENGIVSLPFVMQDEQFIDLKSLVNG